MSPYERFFNSRGKSGTLLAIKQDEARGLHVHIYYIGEDEHVGIRDGIDTWISPIPPHALFTMFDKHELQELIAKAKKGQVIDIEVPTVQRKTLVLGNTHIITDSNPCVDISHLHRRQLTLDLPIRRRALNV